MRQYHSNHVHGQRHNRYDGQFHNQYISVSLHGGDNPPSWPIPGKTMNPGSIRFGGIIPRWPASFIG